MIVRMCGRFDQNDIARRYVAAFGWADAAYRGQARPTCNAAPGTYRPLLHMEDGQLAVDDLYWGYRASWAAEKLPVCYNARLEKVANKYWGRLMKTGRAVVPANGWYEWTGEKGKRQPWHVHRKDREPIFMLALANFGPFKEHKAESGFVLLTADASGGMVDIHDRRPVCLNAADAALWLDPGLPMEQAEMLARSMALGPEEFEWYRVSPELNNAGNDGEHLLLPLPDET
ncbi:Putative SOS response-associated peptidase YedK [Pseudoduganella namucuonensis]|uniref:Abasic site processing protein n=2 Tax=Pseudoduganella namucuonensis TaxID=1035707 RepID=A0A1I7GR02_9BURK|nr:Putative SOS response-associated peptidase YedK [Pseudoduganella namucuonensis]